MKKNLLFTIALLGALSIQAQNVGIGTNTPDASARLDIVDANRGILIPRVALSATNVAAPVTGPATSLLVYNTATAGTAPNNVTPGYYYWSGTQWVRLLDNQSSDWKLDGNTNGALRYIGTNDNFDFPVYTNGTEKMRVTAGGNVGIRTTTPTRAILEVNDVVGTTNAIFGANLQGIGIICNWPAIGFNMYWAGGTGRSISTGYTGLISHDPTSGQMQFRVGQTNAGAANTVVTANTAVVINRTGEVGIGTTTPAASARLDVVSANQGIRIPNVSLTATNNNAPVGAGVVNSLLVYNTATAGTFPNNVWPGYYYWDGAQWVRVGSDGGDWSIRGNTLTGGAATTPNEVLGSNNDYQLHIRTNGALRFRVANDQPQLLAEGNGTVGRPSYSWNGDNTSGMYRSGVGAISFATQGVERLRVTNTPQILSVGDGTAATPAWSWTADNNVGIFRAGADILGFSTNGSERMRINNLGQVVVNNTTPFAGDVFSSYAAGTNAAINAYSLGSGEGVYSQNTSTGFSIASVHTSTGGNLIASNTATATGRAGEFQTLNPAGTAITLFATNSTTTTNVNAAAVWGQSTGVRGIVGLASLPNANSIGINGQYIAGGNIDAIGVLGLANSNPNWGYGVFGQGNWRALYGNGNFAVTGTKAFQIDHPFDPENKFLLHYCLESPEVLNLYRGTITLDANGEAIVQMPDYFSAININFSYQLTPVGSAMPDLFIAEEINANGKFKISGGVPNKKVSWVVYAERNDEWVKQNPFSKVVELDKKPHEKGKYLRPELYNQPKEKAIFDVEAKPQPVTKLEVKPMNNK